MTKLEELVGERLQILTEMQQLKTMAEDPILNRHFRVGISRPTGLTGQDGKPIMSQPVISTPLEKFQQLERDLEENKRDVEALELQLTYPDGNVPF